MIWIMKLDTSKFEFLYAISRAIFPIDTNINISPTSIQPIIIIKKKKKKNPFNNFYRRVVLADIPFERRRMVWLIYNTRQKSGCGCYSWGG